MKVLSSTPEPKDVKTAPESSREVVKTTSYTEPLPEKDASDKPFSAEYFDVPDWGRLLLEPKMDVHGITQKISFIEDYLGGQLKKNSMKSDKDSFREILSDIESSLGLDSKHDLKHRVSRVYGFLNVIKLTKEKEDLRRERLLSMLKK
jgi:hypothetical protein